MKHIHLSKLFQNITSICLKIDAVIWKIHMFSKYNIMQGCCFENIIVVHVTIF